jgi:hypothetical protein
MARTSSGVVTAPVGLLGDTNSRTLVAGVSAESRASSVRWNPVDSSVGTATGTPPARAMASG